MHIKRIMSFLTSAALSVNITLPCSAYGDETTVDGSSVSQQPAYSLDGENSFGNLLADQLSESTVDDDYNGYCRIYDISIDDNTAYISFSAAVDCQLVVSVYSDDGKEMITSEKVDISASETYTKVTFAAEILPEFYTIRAYMIDPLSLTPFSEMFEYNDNSQKMTEFFSKTIEDFDSDKVINLDYASDNNFVVFDDNVVMLHGSESENYLTEADEENGKYIFQNLSDSMLDLQEGDIIAYVPQDNSLPSVVKIGSIVYTENGAEISSADIEMDEVFEYVKIDEILDAGSSEVDTEGLDGSKLEQGISYNALDEVNKLYSPPPLNTANIASASASYGKGGSVDFNNEYDFDVNDEDISIDASQAVSVKFKKKIEDFSKNGEDSPTYKANVTVESELEGKLEVLNSVSVKIYHSKADGTDNSIEKSELKISSTVSADVTLSASANLTIPLFNQYYFFNGFVIKITPKLIFSAEGKVNASCSLKSVVGFSVSDGKTENISKKPVFNSKIKLEGSFSIGIDLGPTLKFITKYLLFVKTTMKCEVKIDAVNEYSLYDNDTELKDKHDCFEFDGSSPGCIDGNVSVIVTLGADAKLFNSDKLHLKLNVSDTISLYDFYYSHKYDESGKGKCPHKKYYYTLVLNDREGNPLENAKITVKSVKGNTEADYKTDSKGKAIVFFCAGSNTVTAESPDFQQFKRNFNVQAVSVGNSDTDSKLSNDYKDDKKTHSYDYNTTYNKTEIVKINQSTDREETITMKPVMYYVSFNITDNTGEPVYGAKADGDYEYAKTDDTFSASSNSLGNLTFMLPNGTYIIEITKKGYTSFSKKITVNGKSISEKAVINDSRCCISVKDQYDDSVNGAHISVNRADDTDSISDSYKTSQNGVCLVSLSEGEYEMNISKFGYDSVKQSFSVKEGGTAVDVNMHCNLLRVCLNVTDSSGKPLSDVSVRSYSDNTLYTTDANGQAVLKLPSGSSKLRLSKSGFAPLLTLVTVEENNSETTIQMEKVASYDSSSPYYSLNDGVLTVNRINENDVSSIFPELYVSGIREIVFSEGITKIPTLKYYDHNTNLLTDVEKIVLPDSVEIINDWAFVNCKSLKYIDCPDKKIEIGGYILNSTEWFANQPDGLVYLERNCIAYKGTAINDTEITFRNDTVSIAESLFYNNNNKKIKSIVFPDTIEYIGSCAFYGCSGLKEIVFPAGTSYVGKSAFEDCVNLHQVKFTNSALEVQKPAFKNTNVDTVLFDENMDTFNYSILKEFDNVKELMIPANIKKFVPAASDNDLVSSHYSIDKIVFEEGTTEITYDIMHAFKTSHVEIPDTVTKFGYRAFYGFSYIYFNDLPVNVIPESIEEIGPEAFIGIPVSGIPQVGVSSIAIPETVKYIDSTAFDAGTVINEVYSTTLFSNPDIKNVIENYIVPEGAMYIPFVPINVKNIEIKNSITTIDRNWFNNIYNRRMLETVKLPETLKAIDQGAFAGCTALKEINIPDSVEYIGKSAFYNCTSLQSITLPPSLKEINSGTFKYCRSLESIQFSEGLEYIGESAFCACDVKSVTLPYSLKSVERSAFSSCSNLGEITVLNGKALTYYDKPFTSCPNIYSITVKTDINDTDKVCNLSNNLPDNVRVAVWYGDRKHEYVYMKNQKDKGTYYVPQNYDTECDELIIPDGSIEIRGSVSGYNESIKKVVIPDSVDTIGEYAFRNFTSLEEIVIPNGVTAINYLAFEGCTSLKEVVIPDSVDTIGFSAFEGCTSLNEIVIPNGVTAISDSAFEDCTSLEEVVIPDSVDTIGHSAFRDCTSLKEVVIPDSVTTIDDYAFRDCTSLKEVVIPDSVTAISKHAFEGCTSLEEVVIPDSVDTIGYSAFENCTSLKIIKIPDSVIRIYDNAFYDCTSLESITMSNNLAYVVRSAFEGTKWYDAQPDGPVCAGKVVFACKGDVKSVEIKDGIEYIPSKLFKGNEGIVSVRMTDSVKYVGSEAFGDCINLEEIVLSDNIEKIPNYMFNNCTALKKVNIPKKAVSVGKNAFYECTSLADVVIPDSVEAIDEYAFYYASIADIRFGKNLKTIGTKAFWGNKMAEIEFPDTLKNIGDSAFQYCYNLENFNIPDSVKYVGVSSFDNTGWYYSNLNAVTYLGRNLYYVSTKVTDLKVASGVTEIRDEQFKDHSALEHITLPGKVERIGTSAFENCTGLTEIVIPGSVKTIGENAFAGCTGLKRVVIMQGVETIEKGAFSDCTGISEVVFPHSMVSIQSEAFLNCTSLAELNLPENISIIGYSAFENCKLIKTITIPEGVQRICGNAFNNIEFEEMNILGKTEIECYIPNLKKMCIGAELSANTYKRIGSCKIDELVFLDGVETIADGAFDRSQSVRYNNFDKVVLPDTLKVIGDNAFAYTSLSEVELPDTLKVIGDGAFACTSLSELELPENLEKIGEGAFRGTNLTSIVIPQGIKEIPDYAFKGSMLSSIEMEGVERIGKYAFSCTKFESLVFPSGITYIDNDAFSSCSFESLILPENLRYIGKNAFSSCSFESLTIPDSVVIIDENAFENSKIKELTISAESKMYIDEPFESAKIDKVIIADGCKCISKSFNELSKCKELVMPNSVKYIAAYSLSGFNELTSLELPEGVETIGMYAISNNNALESVTIPKSVKSIDYHVFNKCSKLSEIQLDSEDVHLGSILQDTPLSGTKLLPGLVKVEEKMGSAADTEDTESSDDTDLESSDTELRELRVKEFTDLKPDKIYNFYSMKDKDSEDPLSADNLIYIVQKRTDKSGVLRVEYFSENYDSPQEFVVCDSIRIEDAVINAENLVFTGEPLERILSVEYNGKLLTEGVDYEILGPSEVTAPVAYTLTVVGKGEYSGKKNATFRVLCNHQYENGKCLLCNDECIHTFENGVCIDCGMTEDEVFPESVPKNDEMPELIIDNTEASSGEEVTLKLRLSEPTSISSILISVDVDSRLEIVEEGFSDEINNSEFFIQKNSERSESKTRISAFSTQDSENISEIYYWKVKVPDTAEIGTFYPLKLDLEEESLLTDYDDSDDHELMCKAIAAGYYCNGGITVSESKQTTVTSDTDVQTETTVTTVSTAPETDQNQKGDVNCDGAVNPVDATLILQQYTAFASGAGSILNAEQIRLADVNGDGIVNPVDATSVLSYYTYKASGGELDMNSYIKS